VADSRLRSCRQPHQSARKGPSLERPKIVAEKSAILEQVRELAAAGVTATSAELGGGAFAGQDSPGPRSFSEYIERLEWFAGEVMPEARVIPTDGRPHVPQSIRLYQGHSVGHWEGNTLVVDTTNFTDLTAFRGSSEKLHLIERFTRAAPDMLIYQFTVEDPATWDKPWTAEVPWSKAQGPVYEWACHEGNTMISTILNGARVSEREAAQKAGK